MSELTLPENLVVFQDPVADLDFMATLSPDSSPAVDTVVPREMKVALERTLNDSRKTIFFFSLWQVFLKKSQKSCLDRGIVLEPFPSQPLHSSHLFFLRLHLKLLGTC